MESGDVMSMSEKIRLFQKIKECLEKMRKFVVFKKSHKYNILTDKEPRNYYAEIKEMTADTYKHGNLYEQINYDHIKEVKKEVNKKR